MILQLSVGAAVQISHVVKMRLSSQREMITLQFPCALISMKASTHAGWFYPACLWRRGERKGTLPLLQSLSTATDGKGDTRGWKTSQREAATSGTVGVIRGRRVTPVRGHCKAFDSLWWRICQRLAEAESGPGILLTLLHLTNKQHSFLESCIVITHCLLHCCPWKRGKSHIRS